MFWLNMKKQKIPKKDKEIAKKIPETNLEKTVKTKVEIPESKKRVEENGEFMDELDAAGIISAGELRQVLKSETKLHQLENIPVSRSLEGGLIFAPRVRDKKEGEGKVYSDTKYNPQYAESRYAEKTPGSYAGKETSSEKGSSNDSNSNGNQ